MLIAFEGPDNVGKSHSAAAISAVSPFYNANVDNYTRAKNIVAREKGLAVCFDRIDWLTHMTYRLAMPGHEWNDARVRTVFAMPDTHLVFKLHHNMSVPKSDEEEGYGEGLPRSVNDMYRHMSRTFTTINEDRDFSLFKTVTTMEVYRSSTGKFHHHVTRFSSPLGTASLYQTNGGLVYSDRDLVRMLQTEDAARV